MGVPSDEIATQFSQDVGPGGCACRQFCCKICQDETTMGGLKVVAGKTRAYTVPIRYVKEIVSAIELRGQAAGPLLAFAELDPTTLFPPLGRLSLRQFSKFYGAVAKAMDDEYVGLGHSPFRVGTLEVICRATLSCATIAEAAMVVAHVMDVVSSTNRVLYEQDECGWRIVWLEESARDALSLLFHEITFVTVYSVLCWLAGKPLPLASTDFPSPMPLHQLDLRAMLPGKMRFDQSRAAIYFPQEVAALPIRREARDIAKVLRTAPAGLIEAAIVNAETSILVRDLLRDALPTLLTLDDVAAKLALSPSTLHRKLHREGQSFQSVKDQLRVTLAHHALTRTEQPMKQVARVLGFADRASFQRAFLNWTGQTPGACRARKNAGKQTL